MKRLFLLALVVALLPVATGARAPRPRQPFPRLDALGAPATGASVAVEDVAPIAGLRRPARLLRAQDEPALTVFNGLRDRTGTNPPDANGDANATHYLQMVNQVTGAVVRVFDKRGILVSPRFELGDLWDSGPCRNHGKGDPVVRYDDMADRWVLMQLAFRLTRSEVGPFYICVFVSGSSDPFAGGTAYTFLIDEKVIPDYPKLGVWPDGYYLSMHLFGPRGFEGQAVIALDRDRMLAGESADQVVFFVNPRDYGVLPSSMDGTQPPPDNAPNYLVVVKDDDLGAKQDRLKLYEFRVDWDDVDSSSIHRIARIPVEPFDAKMCRHAFNCLPQKGTRMQIDALVSDPPGVFTMYPTAYRNFGTHESLIFNHTVQLGRRRAGIRWYELRDLSSSPTVFQHGTVGTPGLSRWVGSIGMDRNGNIALGYSTTSRDTHPAIWYSARLATDPAGTMGLGEHLIVQGRESQKSSSRWGDYTSMSVDPVDDCTFWYTNQYYPEGTKRWRTAVAAIKLPGC